MQRRNTLLSPDQWTPDYVDDYLRYLCETHPDRRNPVDLNGVCSYTGEDGGHCLIGQMLADHGVEMPAEGESALTLAERGVDRLAAWQAERWQVAADDVNPLRQPGRNMVQPAWGSLPAIFAIVDEAGA